MKGTTRSGRRTGWVAAGGAVALVLLAATGAHAEGGASALSDAVLVGALAGVLVSALSLLPPPLAMVPMMPITTKEHSSRSSRNGRMRPASS